MLSSAAFFSPAETVLEVKVNDSHSDTVDCDRDLDQVYETQRCVHWINAREFKRVSAVTIVILSTLDR